MHIALLSKYLIGGVYFFCVFMLLVCADTDVPDSQSSLLSSLSLTTRVRESASLTTAKRRLGPLTLSTDTS